MIMYDYLPQGEAYEDTKALCRRRGRDEKKSSLRLKSIQDTASGKRYPRRVRGMLTRPDNGQNKIREIGQEIYRLSRYSKHITPRNGEQK